MCTKNATGNGNFHSKLPIVVYQISVIESEEFRENSNVLSQGIVNYVLKFTSHHTKVLFTVVVMYHLRRTRLS